MFRRVADMNFVLILKFNFSNEQIFYYFSTFAFALKIQTKQAGTFKNICLKGRKEEILFEFYKWVRISVQVVSTFRWCQVCAINITAGVQTTIHLFPLNFPFPKCTSTPTGTTVKSGQTSGCYSITLHNGIWALNHFSS